MQEIKNATELKKVIEQLALQQTNEYPALKAEVIETTEKLTPINIIRNTLLQIVSTPELSKDLLKATLIYVVGVAIKKIFFGTAANPLLKLVGTIVEILFLNIINRKTYIHQIED